jgi:outer membrane protein
LQAQTPPPAPTTAPRTPSVTYAPGRLGAYRPGDVSPSDFSDSTRMQDLIKAGQLYLSLNDAIALALENNLDLELQRYGVRMTETDILRTEGGGLLRGIPLTVNEAPAGVGGPGSTLNNSAASGTIPQTALPQNVTDTALIQQAQNNLSVTGNFPLTNGPAIPLFDPAIIGQLLAQHVSTPQSNLVVTGTPSLISNLFTGNAGYLQGFSSGTQVNASFQNLRTDNNSTRNLLNPFYTSSLGVTVTQPLMRGFGKEVNRRFIRIARNSTRISEFVFKQQVISTVSGVVRLYTDLVSLNEDLRVKRQTLATAERLAEDNASKVEQGTLAPIELTRAQAQVTAARQDLINSEGFLRQQELILKNTLSRNGNSQPSVHAARVIPTDTITVEAPPVETAEEMIKLALESRPEYQAAKLQVSNSEISLKGSRNGLLPQVDLVGIATNNALAGSANPAYTGAPVAPGSLPGYGEGYGAALGQIVRRDNPVYAVGLNITLPIHNRIAQADLVRDELQVRQSQVRVRQIENQIRLEVEDALIALERTQAAYQAASETRKLQEQSLEIEQERFSAGLSTNFLVIQYENYVAQARSSEVAARGAWAKAKNQMERVLGQTLANHNVSIDEAMKGQVSRQSVVPATSN